MPRGRKKLRGGLLGKSGSCRGESCGSPRVKETRLDCDNSDLQYLYCVPHTLYREDPLAALDDPLSTLTRVHIYHPSDSIASPTKSFREKITDLFYYSDSARSASPVMPVLVHQVSLKQTSDSAMAELPASLPPLSTSSLPPEQSCGYSDSGKENDEVDIVMWRGSRSSINSRTSKTSRPRSGHCSDINTTQQGKLPLLNTAEEGLRGEYPAPSSNSKSPPTPHKIIGLKEPSLCNTLQKLKVNKRQAGLLTSHSGSNSFSTPTLGAQAAIRRSERKPKAELLKEQMKGIEARLLANEDDTLVIEVAFIENKGRGIKALRNFSKGEFVVEYAGDLIDIGTAKDLEAKYSMDTSKGCYMYYFKHKGKQYCIDATAESGRYGRLLNHTRVTPNCMTKVITLGEVPRLILVAKSDIVAGTELLYDYGDRSKESLKAHPWLFQ